MRNSNTSRDGQVAQRWSFRLGRLLLVGLAAACLANTAYGIDPSRAMSQYIRDRWGTARGFPGGPVYAITQTADGYLWIGTEKGLVRFDGLNFRLIQPSNTPSLPAGPVLGLIADAAGNLWVRLRSPGMLRYRDGKFEDVLASLERTEPGITALCRGINGEVLLSALVNGTLRYSEGRFVTLAPMSTLPNFLVISMAETPDGNIWLGTRDAGLFRLSGGQTYAITQGLPDRKINSLWPDGARGLWVGTDSGIVRWNGAELTSSGVPPALNHVRVLSLTGDRDANLWVGTNSHGLLRLNTQGVAALDQVARQPSEAVTAVFEDREGNLWIGTASGLERLRDSAFVTYSAPEALPSESNGPVYVDTEGRTWFAPVTGGLYWLSNGRSGRITAAGLDKDVIYSLAGAGGELWVGRQRGGLTRLRTREAALRAETHTQTQGLAQNSVYAVHQNRDGTIWAGTLSGGVSKFSGGKFTTYTSAHGLASNTIAAILEGSDGTMWFATPNGLSALSDGHWQTYSVRDGLPSENVNCLVEDSSSVLWIGTAAGLAFRGPAGFQLPAGAPSSLREQILGLADDRNGSLWIATAKQVLRVQRDKLMRGALADGDVREYGLADGLHSVEGVKRHRSVVTDPLGRVWFSLNRGLSMVDPARLTNNAAPALVQIQTISADGSAIGLQGPVRIPAGGQRITFGYAGLSLAVPDRVQYRYKLDGYDRGWSEPTALREAPYTNLNPGPYRFRLLASNSDGLWNGAEATLSFELEPLLWQTWWFRLLCALACIFMLAAFYRFRLHRLTRQLNVRFEERLAERTRIAQELHDTLLQGFLSASMQLHVAAEHLPADSTAKPLVNRVLDLMGQVIEEGRNAVRGLRSSYSNTSLELGQAFARIQQELALPEQTGFRVIVEGRPQPLHPIIRDEVYRIGREALVNAFRHSRAKNIEVEVEYAAQRLRILVRDDGCGIDPQVLQSGREGHWGLVGMRERAERIGARLKVRSQAMNGTEIELSVPRQVAFQTQSLVHPLKWPRRWLARLSWQKVRSENTDTNKRGS